LTLLILSITTLAQPPEPRPMSTDRPDFTESPFTVGLGRVQLEAGWTMSRGSGVETNTLGEGLLRYGLSERLELRIGAPSLEFVRSDDEGSSGGLTDASLGLKFELAGQDGGVPNLGLILDSTFPTGSAGFSGEAAGPGATLAWSYELNDMFTLSGNFGAGLARDEDGGHVEGAASLSLAMAVSERWGVYAETFAIVPSGRDEMFYANVGATYLLSPDLQLDARLGSGLNGAADDLFVGVGVSRRW
jgi:hypothetical protein